MIKVIAFDLGGVLFAEGKSFLAEKLKKETNYDSNLVVNILKSSKSIDLRKGLLTDKEFWNWVQEQLPESYDSQLIKKMWYDSYLLDENIFALIKKLHGKIKLIVFSGNIKSRIEYLDKKYGFRKLFDREVYSFDFHLNKPDRTFLEVMIREAGAEPNEIAYIDDNVGDAVFAKELGVNLIIYSRGKMDQLQKELRKLGVDL